MVLDGIVTIGPPPPEAVLGAVIKPEGEAPSCSQMIGGLPHWHWEPTTLTRSRDRPDALAGSAMPTSSAAADNSEPPAPGGALPDNGASDASVVGSTTRGCDASAVVALSPAASVIPDVACKGSPCCASFPAFTSTLAESAQGFASLATFDEASDTAKIGSLMGDAASACDAAAPGGTTTKALADACSGSPSPSAELAGTGDGTCDVGGGATGAGWAPSMSHSLFHTAIGFAERGALRPKHGTSASVRKKHAIRRSNKEPPSYLYDTGIRIHAASSKLASPPSMWALFSPIVAPADDDEPDAWPAAATTELSTPSGLGGWRVGVRMLPPPQARLAEDDVGGGAPRGHRALPRPAFTKVS